MHDGVTPPTFACGYDGWSAALYHGTLYIHFASALYNDRHKYEMKRYQSMFRIVKTQNRLVDISGTTEEVFVAALLRGEI